MQTKHSAFIRKLVADPTNQGKFTRQQLSEAASKECGHFISVEQVRQVLRQIGRQDFTKRDNGKMEVDSTLKGAEMSIQSRIETEADFSALRLHCEAEGLPVDDVAYYWHKTNQMSVFVRRPGVEVTTFKEELITDIKKHAPHYKKRKVDPNGDNLLVLPMADIHVGKLLTREETGHEYDITKALDRVRESTAHLVGKASVFGVKKFVVGIGNDVLHTDNGKSSTAGTPQDTDGTWFSAFRAARKLYTSIIEQLALHADVHLVFIPSNHDWRSGYALAEVVAASFTNHPNVTSDINEYHRKYVVFGHNLIMFTHGDGAKEKDLHWLLASEAAEAWSKTKYRYIYTGHIHHKVRRVNGSKPGQYEKDNIGFTLLSPLDTDPHRDVHIEYVRSPSPPDGWHHRNGYTNLQAMEAFLHNPERGQECRFTHYF